MKNPYYLQCLEIVLQIRKQYFDSRHSSNIAPDVAADTKKSEDIILDSLLNQLKAFVEKIGQLILEKESRPYHFSINLP
jgi:hypothetical protein